MQSNIIQQDCLHDYEIKEAGPIILALSLVIALGGVATAAIIICGWGRVKSVGVNWTQRRAEIVCR